MSYTSAYLGLYLFYSDTLAGIQMKVLLAEIQPKDFRIKLANKFLFWIALKCGKLYDFLIY